MRRQRGANGPTFPDARGRPSTATTTQEDGGTIRILWISGGLSCDAESVSLTSATQPSIEETAVGAVPGLPKIGARSHVVALFAGEGHHKLAGRLLGEGARARPGRGVVPALYLKDRLADDRAMDTVRRALGEESTRAWELGSASPREVLVGEAQEALGAGRDVGAW
jgi:hypothetical protein